MMDGSRPPHITYHADMVQGSDDWLAARCGLLTASEMKLILTPTLKIAANEKERAQLYELLAQRITKYVEPHYIGDDMMRGQADELEAKSVYHKDVAPVTDCGFITNNRYGFTLGYSPDWLVGDDGQAECKSRRQKYQVQTIIENVWDDESKTIPAEYVMQHQTGLLVTERKWIDFVSYCGGMPMAIIRQYPDPVIQNAIIEASGAFEDRMQKNLGKYMAALASKARLFPTERKYYQEMFL